jgi:hypothetical protein
LDGKTLKTVQGTPWVGNKTAKIIDHLNLTGIIELKTAIMVNYGIKRIFSADPHFDLIPGIRRIDPAKF